MTTLADRLDRRLMLAFTGTSLPKDVAQFIAAHAVSGVTLFRESNYGGAPQLRELTDAIQTAHPSADPMLIATDQEGGQLLSVGPPATPFPGNMALGAAGDPELTERVGAAIGHEMRAVGINVNYAPVCDLVTNPHNPALGTRAFGDDPDAVSQHAAAMVRGLQASGVAATVKHFPGKGDARVDSHHNLPVMSHDRARLDSTELVPFRAGVQAGAMVAMTGHFVLPAIAEADDLPSTLSRNVNTGLLRDEVGFDGVLITDALDMKAITQGPAQIVDVIAAVRSGVDLLLLTADHDMQDRVTTGLRLAVSRGLIETDALVASDDRVGRLRRWLGGFSQPDLDIVGSAEHRDLALAVAARSITLVRNDAGVVPLRPDPGARILVVQPEPKNLTPADTSRFETGLLADALRRYHPNIESLILPFAPARADIDAAKTAATEADLVVLGTLAASTEPAQADLAAALLTGAVPVITVAMRTPFDLVAHPTAPTHLCSYSITPPALSAVAAVLFGRREPEGTLPVGIPDLYERGHGLTR